MSTAAPTIGPGGLPGGQRGDAPRSIDAIDRQRNWPTFPFEGWFRRVPVEDWITFILLGVMLVSVGWAVQLAEWGDLPPIIPTLLMGWVAGFIASRNNLPAAVNIVLMLVIGFGVMMWQGSIPAEGANVAERARDAWDRFWAWITVAQEGGISNDSVPFSLMFMTASWITAYTVTALTYRVRNPWTPIVLLAVGLMSNLSFRPGLHEQTFFIFILASIALFAHLTAVRRMDRWGRQGIRYPVSLAWLSMFDGLLFGGIIVLFVVILPVFEPRSQALDDAWEVLKTPIEALEDPANRLLSGVKAQEGSAGLSLPDEVLTFKGQIELTEDPLAWVTSRYSTMLPGRVYDRYDSNGWLATAQIVRSVEARSEVVPVPQELGRERIEQLIQPLVDTDLVLPAGGVYSVDRDAQVEYLQPVTYRVPLTGAVGSLADLPDDVRQFAFDTRFELRDMADDDSTLGDVNLNNQPLMSESEVVEALTPHIPDELEIRLDINGDGAVSALNVTRIGPEEPVGALFEEVIPAERLYTVTTYVLTADDADLQISGSNYPGWVKDRYLTLPDSLPIEVRILANQIVQAAGARTPFEKAQAIKSFLQRQEYSLEISGPSANQDGVFYFLFETQSEPCPSDNPGCDPTRIKGYSQYYGSAGTVLLRAAGIPARMVAGWAAGDYVPAAGKFLIRDKHRHGWTQAYFADYGWVDIEVTPGRPELDRGQQFSVEPSTSVPLPDIEAIEDDPLLGEDIAGLEELARQARELALAQREAQLAAEGDRFPVMAVVIPASIAGAILLIYLGWIAWHRGMSQAEQAYTKMVRSGRLLGVRRRQWQTPTEYAAAIGAVAPGVAESAMLIAIEYERGRYASPESVDDAEGLQKHWRRVLRGLLGYRARVVGGAGPELGEGRAAV